MATGNPCKRCERNCVKNGGLPFNMTLSLDCNGVPSTESLVKEISSLISALKIMACPCCLGENLADHALLALMGWFSFKIKSKLNGFFNDKRGCDIDIQLTNIDIKMKIQCNNQDIEDGKEDQASTEITGDFNLQVAHAGNCKECGGSE